MGGICRPSNLSLGAAIVVKIFKMSGALSFISFKMSDQENTFASSECLDLGVRRTDGDFLSLFHSLSSFYPV